MMFVTSTDGGSCDKSVMTVAEDCNVSYEILAEKRTRSTSQDQNDNNRVVRPRPPAMKRGSRSEQLRVMWSTVMASRQKSNHTTVGREDQSS